MLPLTSFKEGDFAQLWKEVENLELLGQQREALNKVEAIYAKARTEINGPQTVKAAIHKVKFIAQLEEDGQAKAYQWLGTEQPTYQGELHNLMLSIQAEVLWGYYNQNQWQINQRAQLTEPGNDLLLWDLRTITQKTDSLIMASLVGAEKLRGIPVGNYEAVLNPQPDTRPLRPTLHEFLVSRALDFYTDHQSELAHFEPYGLFDDARLLGLSEDFLKLPKDTATFSPGHRALWLHHRLMLGLANAPEALVVADLDRLNYCHSRSTNEAKDSLYLATLSTLQKQFDGSPMWAEVAYRKALFFKAQGDAAGAATDPKRKDLLLDAYQLCQRIAEYYPTTFGGRNAVVLMSLLNNRHLGVTTEQFNAPGKPMLMQVMFQNLSAPSTKTTSLALRIGRIDFKAYSDNRRQLYGDKMLDWLNKNATTVHERVQPLTYPTDLRYHTTELSLPALEHGDYVVFLGSSDKLFATNEAVAWAIFHVSDLAMISADDNEGTRTATVVDRVSGINQTGVSVRLFEERYNNKNRGYEIVLAHQLSTNAQGEVTIPQRNDGNYRQYLVELVKDDRTTYIQENLYRSWNQSQPVRSTTTTQFFTDRAIYRPGQTIQFKGIMYDADNGKLSPARDRNTEVTLYDANGQKVSSLSLRSNAFGTFSGTFPAPTGTLNGYISMSNEHGSHSIRLEEYKRPNFEVKLEQPKAQFKLKDQVSANGSVISYAGIPLSGTEVKYTVVRTARFPYPWRCWGWNVPTGSGRQVAMGTATTNADGQFTVTFPAEPDPTIRSRYRPVFSYEVKVDATDRSGETQSARTSVAVAYHALDLQTDVPATIQTDKLNTVRLWATNLSGQKQPAAVKVRLDKLSAPATTFRSRAWGIPDVASLDEAAFRRDFPNDTYLDADNNREKWAIESTVLQYDAQLPEAGATLNNVPNIKPGAYRLTLTGRDAFGEEVDLIEYFVVDQKSINTLPVPEDIWFDVAMDTAQPGETIEVRIGSGFSATQFRFEVEVMSGKGYGTRIIESNMILVDQLRPTLTFKVTNDWIGNANIRIWSVRHGRFLSASKMVFVPNKKEKLNVKLETFRSTINPNAQEDWKLSVVRADGKRVKTEMLASMYDASLDALAPNPWSFSPYRSLAPTAGSRGVAFGNSSGQLQERGWRKSRSGFQSRLYDNLNWFGFWGGFDGGGGRHMYMDAMVVETISVKSTRTAASRKRNSEDEESAGMADMAAMSEPDMAMAPMAGATGMNKDGDNRGGESPSPEIAMRTDLSETVFFRPHLASNEKGEVNIQFKAPQQLSRWKFQAWAVSDSLASGTVMQEVVTQKEVMVTVNVPRFFREGDKIWLSARIDALSDAVGEVKASLQLIDAMTGMDILPEKIQTVKLTGKQAEARWEVLIPNGKQAITVRTKAWTAQHSDGVEHVLPVLPDRILVQESLPIAVRRAGRHEVILDKLAAATGPDAPENVSLTLEFTPNPAWLAVLSLPYMMEYPYDCAEQTFSRIYANSIAVHLANSDPAIKLVYEQWKRDAATGKNNPLQSPLEKNPDLKRVLLQETPWVRDAQDETEQRKRLGELFNLDLMAQRMEADLTKLEKMQNPDGGWGWFGGLRSDFYMTRHIVSGIGHLRKLGVVQPNPKLDAMLNRAIIFYDEQLADWLRDRRKSRETSPLSINELHMAYARSFFLDSHLLQGMALQAFNEIEHMAQREWMKQSPYGKALSGLVMQRNGEKQVPRMIIQSLTDNALRSEEFGMWYKNGSGWYWYEAPIETHAMITEFFHDMGETASVNELNVWLLKQKQTQAWKTTKATADACYILLRTGSNTLSTDRKVHISIGGNEIDQSKLGPEAGTGYIRKSWTGSDIGPDKASVQIMNPTEGMAWGALHWQYMEQLDRITPSTNAIKMERQLFVKRNTGQTEVLISWDKAGPVKVGEVVVSRMTVVCDRYLEYVHIKDMRPSAFEPREQLSGPQYQDGLSFYRANSDASVNLFFPNLPKGTFVFEYAMNVAQAGQFSVGITDLQCMYAPEFTVHTGGKRVGIGE